MKNWTDQEVENTLGNLLRWGVIISGLIVFAGGVIYLLKYGSQLPDYRAFHGEPAALTNATGIVKAVITAHPRAIIQLGLLLLIATPVARVTLSVYGFIHQRDRTYIVITLIVLAILIFSLSGHV